MLSIFPSSAEICCLVSSCTTDREDRQLMLRLLHLLLGLFLYCGKDRHLLLRLLYL
jgi:hypothetical protein